MSRSSRRTDHEDDSNFKGLSRRDFVQGRFWRALRLRNRSIDGQGNPRAGTPPKPLRRIPLVMRYPKSLREVGAGDGAEAKTNPITASASRRRTIPVFRPPGAIEESLFLEGCTRCDKCVQACPEDAIIHAPERLREAAGTPIIDADQQPCVMCDDFPCITACEPDVLTSLIPKMMGTARVTEHLCLAHHGTTCTVCSERCVVEGAIEVVDGKPTVDEATCTGCGVCRYVCPAPENAILLMPTFLRPSPAPRNPNRGTRSDE